MAEVRPPIVGALLLNWRGAEMTLQCLADLLAVDDVALHVFVLDNGSGAARSGEHAGDVEQLRAAIEAYRRAPDPGAHRVELIALERNLGFTGGMNHGMRLAHDQGLPFVLVLNNDLRLPKDFLQPLLATMQNDAGVAAVGPTVLHDDGTVWAEGGEVGFVPNALRLNRHGKSPRPKTAGPEAVGFLPGACVLLRTAQVAELGYFDDRYFMYWEDVDLCERLRRTGGRIVWLPWVQIEHHAGASSGGGRSPLRKFLMACNAVRYLKQNGSVRGWSAWLLFDVLLWPLTLLSGPKAAIAKLRGTFAGLTGHVVGAADVTRHLG